MGTPAMKKSLLCALVLSAAVSAALLFTPSKACAWAGAQGKTAVPETFIVVKIGDDYKAIGKSTLKNERKRVDDEYATKVKEWHDLRKTDPTAPHPVKPIIKIIGTPYETQKIAQKAADDLKDEAANKDDATATTKKHAKQ